jgi:hypothetical protein
VDGGSVVGFGISEPEPSGSATRESGILYDEARL